MEFLPENLRNNLRDRNFSPESRIGENLIDLSGSEESLLLNPIDEIRPDVGATPHEPIPRNIPTSTPKFSEEDLETVIRRVTENLAKTVITTSKENNPSSGFTLPEPTVLQTAGGLVHNKKGISELGTQLLANAAKYDGSDKKPLQDFILEFRQLIPLLLNKSDSGKLSTSQELYLGKILKLLLKGDALRYVEGLPDRNSLTYNQIFLKLKDRFRSPRNSLFYQEKLRNLAQNNMSVTVLSEKLLKYAKNYVETSTDVQGEEKEKLILSTASHYILGALKPAIFEKLIEREVGSDYQKIIEEAKRIEQILLTIEIRNGTKIRKVATIGQNVARDNITQIPAERTKMHAPDKFNGGKGLKAEGRKQGGREMENFKHNEKNFLPINRPTGDRTAIQNTSQNQMGYKNQYTQQSIPREAPFQERNYFTNNAFKYRENSNVTPYQQGFSTNLRYPGFARNQVENFYGPRQQYPYANYPYTNRRTDFQSNRYNGQGGQNYFRPEQITRGFRYQSSLRPIRPQFPNNGFQNGRGNQYLYNYQYVPFTMRNNNNLQRPNVQGQK